MRGGATAALYAAVCLSLASGDVRARPREYALAPPHSFLAGRGQARTVPDAGTPAPTQGCLVKVDSEVYGASDCDEAWLTHNINCTFLVSKYVWDCSGCLCIGDIVATSSATASTTPAATPAPPPGECRDVVPIDSPHGFWHDNEGPAYNCQWYSDVPDRCATWGSIEAYEKYGHLATEACCNCSQREPTPAPAIFDCEAGHLVFNAGYGGCDTYADGGPNNQFCLTDTSVGLGDLVAYQVCPECGRCAAAPTPAPMPTPAPTLPVGCEDWPGWQDKYGDNCNRYLQGAWCTFEGEEGVGWQPAWGGINESVPSAFDACCGCGGGSFPTPAPTGAPTPPPPPCVDPCGRWSGLALRAACPKHFQLAAGVLKQASLAAWNKAYQEPGAVGGDSIASCSVTGVNGTISSVLSFASFPMPTLAPSKLRFVVSNSDLYKTSFSSNGRTLGPELRAEYQVWDSLWRSEAGQWVSWWPEMKAIIYGVNQNYVWYAACSKPNALTGMGSCQMDLGALFSKQQDVQVKISVEGIGVTEYYGASMEHGSYTSSARVQDAVMHRDVSVEEKLASISEALCPSSGSATASGEFTICPGSVYLVLPAHPFWLGETFEADVKANTGEKFFKQLDASVHWDQSTVSLLDIWIPGGAFASNYKLAIEAFSSEGQVVGAASGCIGACTWQGVLDRESGGQLLAGNFNALRLRLLLPSSIDGAAAIADAIRAEVNFFKHEENGNYFDLGPPAGSIPVIGAEGVVGSALPTTANIAIVYDSTVALFGSFHSGVVSGTLFNTAVLDNEPVEGHLELRRISSFGTGMQLVSGATCSGLDSTAFSCSVSGSAVKVEVLPSHTTGQFKAFARLAYDSHQVDVRFAVLFPDIFTVYSQSGELGNVAAPGSCSNEYETSNVFVEAKFKTPDAPVAYPAVDATPLLLSKLRIASGSSHVSLSGSTIKGLSEGTAQIEVQGFSGATAAVTVSSAVVTPILSAVVLDDAVATAKWEYYAGSSVATVIEANQTCDFDREGDTGYVFTFAEGAGYTRLLPPLDVELSSLEATSVQVVSPMEMVVATGASDVCDFALTSRLLLDGSPECPGGDISVSADINLSLPQPCGLEFTLSTSSIAPSGDMATMYPYNVATSSRVTSVIVAFCMGGTELYSREMVSDNRTEVTLSDVTNVVHRDGVFEAEANIGGALVTVSFQGLVSQRQEIEVKGHRTGSLPVPCAATMALTHYELSDPQNSAALPPFELPPSSVVQTLELSFCVDGTAVAVNGQLKWKAVSEGQRVPEASHWGLAVESSSSALAVSESSASVNLQSAEVSGRATVSASFASSFAPDLGVSVTVDVLRSIIPADGEWCVTNDASSNAENRQCKSVCSSNLVIDSATIAFAGSVPTKSPFNYPTEAHVTAFNIQFCAPGCGSCQNSETFDMKEDYRAQIAGSGVSYSSLVATPPADAAIAGSLSASLMQGGSRSEHQVTIDVIAFGSAQLTLKPQSDSGGAPTCSADCRLKLVGCSSKFQWADVFMSTTLVQGSTGSSTTKDCTAQATFASSSPSAMPAVGSALQGLSAVQGAVVTGEYFGQTAQLTVSVVEEHLEVTQIELLQFPSLFRGRQAADGSIEQASPCPGQDSCVREERLKPVVTLSDGTTYSFSAASTVRGTGVAEVISFSQSGGACHSQSCSTSSAITIASDGLASLQGQSPELTVLRAEAATVVGTCGTSTSAQTTSVVANVDAAPYDVDLGNSEELVFPRLQDGQQWEIPIYVETGSEYLTNFDLTIKLPSDHFTLDGCSSFESTSCGDAYASFCWPGHDFFCNALPLLDGYRMTGQKADNRQIRGRVRVATVTVTAGAASSEEVPVTGTIAALSVPSGNKVSPGTAFFAGTGSVNIDAGRLLEDAPKARRPLAGWQPTAPSRALTGSCSSLQGMSLSDMNSDSEVSVLDSVALLEKYVTGAYPECGCDPTFNSVTDLNDFNLLSLAIVTSLLLLDRSSVVASLSQDGLVLTASAALKCSGCTASDGCAEHAAAFASTTVKMLLATTMNADIASLSTHGSSVESATSGLVIARTEHVGDGLFELRAVKTSALEFTIESGIGLAVHQNKGTRQWGWNDDSADLSTSLVRPVYSFNLEEAAGAVGPTTSTTTATQIQYAVSQSMSFESGGSKEEVYEVVLSFLKAQTGSSDDGIRVVVQASGQSGRRLTSQWDVEYYLIHDSAVDAAQAADQMNDASQSFGEALGQAFQNQGLAFNTQTLSVDPASSTELSSGAVMALQLQTTAAPTAAPTQPPTPAPPTPAPTLAATSAPTTAPATSSPTPAATSAPTTAPATSSPTPVPTAAGPTPLTPAQTDAPSQTPAPTDAPSQTPAPTEDRDRPRPATASADTGGGGGDSAEAGGGGAAIGIGAGVGGVVLLLAIACVVKKMRSGSREPNLVSDDGGPPTASNESNEPPQPPPDEPVAQPRQQDDRQMVTV